MRGERVDFARYMSEEGDRAALGNGQMNARGDILDKDGNIVTTRAEISASYYKTSSKAVKQVSIKDIADQVYPSPAQAVKDLTDKFQANERAKATAAEEKFGAKPRKISDKE